VFSFEGIQFNGIPFEATSALHPSSAPPALAAGEKVFTSENSRSLNIVVRSVLPFPYQGKGETEGIELLVMAFLIYDRYWTHPEDQIREWKHKLIKCAEVLVPNMVPVGYIVGAIVCDQSARSQLQKAGFTKPINIEPSIFF